MITTGFDSNRYGVAGWGTATADLRGLGPQCTVVLVNGKRLGLGDPNTGNLNPAPDLDQVPLPMIERVDVLTGGASATYGSDAVAGVVNFILKDHVQGVQIDAQYAFAQHAQDNYYLQSVEAANGFAHPTGTTIDGFTRDVSVLAGTGFHDGEGQVTGYFVYHDQDALYGSDRDFTVCPAVSANYFNGCPLRAELCVMGTLTQTSLFRTLAMGIGIRSSVTSSFRGRLQALFHPLVSTWQLMSPCRCRIPGTRLASSPMST
jgi:hypothetical protein